MCHQTVSLTARELESRGIVTVIIGSAMDIVTHCAVPRYLHLDLPLGNPLGPPWDHLTHRDSVVTALNLAAEATHSVIKVSEVSWPGDPDWRSVYNRVDETNREQLQQLGEENRRQRAASKQQGLVR